MRNLLSLFSSITNKSISLYEAIRADFRETTNPLKYLPDFDNFEYTIAIKPPDTRVFAWSKLCECERRLEFFRWIEKLIDPGKGDYRVLLNDAKSAFLLCFEATIQYVISQFVDQFGKAAGEREFYALLKSHAEYDLVIKGIRTLRHIEAHVETKLVPSKVVAVIGGSKADGTSATRLSRSWHFASLTEVDLQKLHHTPPLASKHLSDWNSMVENTPASDIFAHGLKKLKSILKEADKNLEI